MAYIGQEPGLGQAQRSIFTAVAVTNTVTADDDGLPLNYTVGQVSVYLNGVKQVIGDDIETPMDGSTVVFATNYAIGDVVEVIALSTFSPADTVPASGGTFSGNIIVPTATASGHAVTKAQLDASAHTPEGTAILSTGETGTAKFLRIDGDGTSSWQAAGSPSITDNGNAVAMTIDTSEDCTFAGNLFPTVDNSKDLGSASKRWRNIYTTDLHLANDRGNWTVIEEENYLTLRNNNTDKVYKLVMEEIE